MSGIKNGSYQESADDIYDDLINELSLILDESEKDNEITVAGIVIALDLIKEKRAELYS